MMEENDTSTTASSTLLTSHPSATTTTTTTRRRRKRRRGIEVKAGCDEDDDDHKGAHDDNDEPPFVYLMLRVGIVVALLFFVLGYASSFLLSNTPEMITDDNDDDTMTKTTVREPEHPVEQAEEEETTIRLPQFPLSSYSKNYDAFAIAAASTNTGNNPQFWRLARELRERFTALYGGKKDVARSLLDRSFHFHDAYDDVHATACRFQHARQQQRPFTFALGGYSVTSGHGNRPSQAYPHVMETLLRPLLTVVNLTLHVRNAGIGGCPSFPYGWCMDSLLFDNNSTIPDVVSWDFRMNHAGDEPMGLEAYLRRVVTSSSRQAMKPQFLVMDTHTAHNRQRVVHYYQQHTTTTPPLLPDPLILHTDLAVEPFLEQLTEDELPIGLQEWRKFGAPPGAPGQTLHHPAVKEHAFMAWMLTMYYLSALQVWVGSDELNDCEKYGRDNGDASSSTTTPLPRPLFYDNETTLVGESLFFGEPTSSSNSDEWIMNPVHCRTSFQPLAVEGKNLTSLVSAGGVAHNVSISLPKSNMYYGQGWVYDWSEAERKAQRKLERFHLPFKDRKPAYYGIYASGPLTLQLPPLHKKLKSVVICKVNEMRSSTATCDSARDVNYTIAGIPVLAVAMSNTPTLYVGKSICVYLQVPWQAKDCEKCSVTMTVHNQHVNRKEHACSVSHVIWEEENEATTVTKES